MPSLVDLPVEVIIDNLLPYIPLKDLLSLTTTSKEFAAICSDDTFWKRKLQEDYNFADASSARTKGYKFLYRGVHRAKLYVWGASGNGRLGLDLGNRYRHSGIRTGIRTGSMPFPTALKIPGRRIVELAAGGWSFHALDSEGSLHVWGQLDGNGIGGLLSDPFSYRTKLADTPTKLILPERISKIGCGRSHATALSSRGRVWLFPSWGRPYVLTTPLLSTSSTFSTPAQIECGWSFSAVLTHGGEVYVWWPFEGDFGRLTTAHDEACDAEMAAEGAGSAARVRSGEGGVQCRVWEVERDPWLVCPVMTSLPNLRGEEGEEEEKGVGERIVKIAGGEKFLVGLTEGGHVLKVNLQGGQADFEHQNSLLRPRWEYLENFSQVEHVRNHLTFDQTNPQAQPAPETLTITHISANFHTFFAYSTGSSSIILKGSPTTSPTTVPEIIPALQHRDIISIIVGDYHFGALTATGRLLTWGAFSSGALGLGDPTQIDVGRPGGYPNPIDRERAKRQRITPPNVEAPEEVRFGTEDGKGGRKSFVFGATAAGWHTGALVIDLEDNEEQSREKGKGKAEEEGEEGSFEEEERRQHDLQSVAMPGGWGGQMPYRVGLAGRRNQRFNRGGP